MKIDEICICLDSPLGVKPLHYKVGKTWLTEAKSYGIL